jgi:GxxExxY protein
MLQEELSGKVIGVFYAVYNTLGHGFLEKVYENAMMIELRKAGLHPEQQKRIDVYYYGEIVGEYFADIVVNELIILELKAAEAIAPEHEAQLLNYLKGTEVELGLLFNFGPKPQFIRQILTNDKKNLRANP